jgi:hypothetical protein
MEAEAEQQFVIASPDPANVFRITRTIGRGSGRGPTMAGWTPKGERHSLRISDDGRSVEDVYTRINTRQAAQSSLVGRNKKRAEAKEENKKEREIRNIEKMKRKYREQGKKKGEKKTLKKVKKLQAAEAKEIVQQKYHINDKLSDEDMRDYIYRLTNSSYPTFNHSQLVAVYDQTKAIARDCPQQLFGIHKVSWVKGKFNLSEQTNLSIPLVFCCFSFQINSSQFCCSK